MDNNKEHFRHILLFYFRRGKKAANAHRKLCAVYGADAITERTCQIWYQKFKSGTFEIHDALRSGRPMETSDDQIKSIIKIDRHVTVREIAGQLHISKTAASRHLVRLGYVKNLDIWIPHQLSNNHLMQRFNICDMLLKRNITDTFLKRLITGDEKWITYSNVIRKRSWSKRGESSQTITKAERHQKKVMLSIWWDYKGVVYLELLPRNTTIISDVYCHQLDKLNDSLKQKRPELVNRRGVVFHQDNAKPHTSLKSRQKIQELGWDLLPHPPYSPDLAPSDYYLFRSLQNSLAGKNFTSDDGVKSYLESFFAKKDQKFYEKGIMILPERWQQVVDSNGQYVI